MVLLLSSSKAISYLLRHLFLVLHFLPVIFPRMIIDYQTVPACDMHSRCTSKTAVRTISTWVYLHIYIDSYISIYLQLCCR